MTELEFEVERAYREYSNDVWCAGWMHVSDETLWEFANWLTEWEI